MLGRGVTRFVLVAVLLIAGVYLSGLYSGALPEEWAPNAKTSLTSDSFSAQHEPVFPSTDDVVSFPNDHGETDLLNHVESRPLVSPEVDKEATISSPAASVADAEVKPKGSDTFLPEHYIYNDPENVHRTVYSLSTPDKKYFPIIFGSKKAYNPNIIPHRSRNDTYIIVAQDLDHSVEQSIWFAEIVCNAQFVDGKLLCEKEPSILPIAATFSDLCLDNLGFFGYNVGPHDARVFYGPTAPFVLYGSNSAYTCFGQFVQDFRLLVNWGFDRNLPKDFRAAKELQKPNKYSPIEKNFFLFWDADGKKFVHHDVAPKRVFAALEDDGSVGPDLGPAANDDVCLAKHMPAVAKTLESIHQATNALSITLCNRSDTSCHESDSNTFIFHLFHHKSYYSFHSNYEPYIMLIQQRAPYSVHAIGQKPIWIHGRALPGQGKVPDYFTKGKVWDQTEMMYITSISWATHNQTYHGYLDDPLFLNFGIEDHLTGGIDIRAGDLFQDLALCSA